MRQDEKWRDCWQTPEYMRNWVRNTFLTNVDGCADKHNRLHEMYIGLDNAEFVDFLNFDEKDLQEYISCNEYLDQPRIFVNPPYSNPMPFVQRAVQLMTKHNMFVVMLLPADKSTKWYKLINLTATQVIDIIGGRIDFVNPNTGKSEKGNSKGSIIVVFDPNMAPSFVNAEIELDFIKGRSK